VKSGWVTDTYQLNTVSLVYRVGRFQMKWNNRHKLFSSALWVAVRSAMVIILATISAEAAANAWPTQCMRRYELSILGCVKQLECTTIATDDSVAWSLSVSHRPMCLFGVETCRGPRHIVLDRSPAPPTVRGRSFDAAFTKLLWPHATIPATKTKMQKQGCVPELQGPWRATPICMFLMLTAALSWHWLS